VSKKGTIPYNEDVERDLALGAILYQSHTADIAGELSPEDFYVPLYSHIWEIFLDLYCDKGQTFTSATVVDECARRGWPLNPADLISLTVNGYKPVASHIDVIRRDVLARRLLNLTTGMSNEIVNGGDPYEILDDISRFTKDLGEVNREPTAVTMEELIEASVDGAPWVIPGLMKQDWRALLVASEGGSKALDAETPIATPTGWTTMGELQVGDEVFDELGAVCSVIGCTDIMLDRPCYRVEFSDGSFLIADASHQWVVVPYEGRCSGKWDYSTVTTEQMADTLMARNGFTKNYAIDLCGPLEYPAANLSIDPYALGAWLGDGASAGAGFTSADTEIVDQIRSIGYEVDKKSAPYQYYISISKKRRFEIERAMTMIRETGISLREAERVTGVERWTLAKIAGARGMVFSKKGPKIKSPLPNIEISAGSFVQELRTLNVLNNKHIPRPYLESAPWQRLALLQGLMDTDGSVSSEGAGVGRGFGASHVSYTSTCYVLAEGVLELALSLGFKATMKRRDAKLNGRKISDAWSIMWQTETPVFRLKRKLDRQYPLRTHRSQVRYVSAVVPVDSVPVKCIQVNSPSCCYLAGKNLIPTHNSTVLRALLMCASQGFHALDNRGIVFRDRIAIDPQRTLLCDFENPSDAITETGALLMNHLQQVSPDYDSTRFRMWRQLEGFNLRKRSDRAELIREITFQKPTIVSMGPWYKMGRRKAGEGYEDVADDMLAILDELRTKYGFALFLEHHAPKGQGAQRVLDPFGSQRLLAWPDLGLSLRPVPDTDNLDIERHRGDRMKNDWPTMIVRDPKWLIRGSWPLPPFGT
jgi:replicative DNA helicase